MSGENLSQRPETAASRTSADPMQALPFRAPSNLPEAQACNYSRDEIEELGEQHFHEFFAEPAQNIEPVIEQLGGRLHYVDMEQWFETEDGSIHVHGPGNFDIIISSFRGPLRNRFTIAHELGHYVLHSNRGERPLKAARHGRTPVEVEANLFAASLLMPRSLFKKAAEQRPEPLHLAGRFLVSVLAATVRLRSFGYSV